MNHALTETRRFAGASLQLVQHGVSPPFIERSWSVSCRHRPWAAASHSAYVARRFIAGGTALSRSSLRPQQPAFTYPVASQASSQVLPKRLLWRTYTSRVKPASAAKRSSSSPSGSMPSLLGKPSASSSAAGRLRGKGSQARTVRTLGDSKLREIFGSALPEGTTGAQLGNHLLEHLQKQRRSGTLDQPLSLENVTPELASRALVYLRLIYPMDEDAAIIRRIELEEEGRVQRAEEWKPQQRAADEGVYGKSKFDEIRQKNEEAAKKAEAEQEALREEERKNTKVVYEAQLVYQEGKMQRRVEEIHITGSEGNEVRKVASTDYIPAQDDLTEHVKLLSAAPADKGLVRAPNGYAVLRQKEDRLATDDKWWYKYERQAQLTDWDGMSEPPHMPLWRRLGLPTIFMSAVLAFCYVESEIYEPLGQRLFADIPPAAATVYGLIAANVLVALMWRVPPLWRFMNRTFLMHAVIPRPIQLLGCVFSHQQALHLLWNMGLLWWVGTSLCDEIGRGDFLALYLGAGVFSSWTSLVHFVAMKSWRESSLGASGALAGVLFCYLLLNSGRYLELPLPGESKSTLRVPTDAMVYGLVGVEILGLLRIWVLKKPAKIDHFSHLGGFAAGWAAAKLLRQKARRNAEKERKDKGRSGKQGLLMTENRLTPRR